MDDVAVGDLATQALLVEARLTPKPGLVDADGTGAHDDMDLATFEASAAALRPWFARCAAAGRAGATPGELVEIGLAAEAAMLAATGGVNTHKGALYSLGLVCVAAGGLLGAGQALTLEDIGDRVAALATAIAPPTPPDPLAHGDVALAALGLDGARGEARRGLPLALDAAHSLAAHRAAGWAEEDALRSTLVALMSVTQDTNLVARGGLAALRAVQDWARGLLTTARRGGPELRGDAFLAELRRADAEFSAHRWSPGGSADLLAVAWCCDRLTSTTG